MLARLRRFARRTLIKLGIIDEYFRRAKPADDALDRGLLAASRPDWLRIESTHIDSLMVNREYADKFDLRSLTHAVLRSGSLAMRDPLALKVSGGRFDYSELSSIIRAYGNEGSRDGARLILGSLQFADLEYFQKALAGKNLTRVDKDLAIYLLQYLAENPEVDTLVETEQILFTSKLVGAGLMKEARDIAAKWLNPTVTQRQIRTDVINPFHFSNLSDSPELWLVAFNSVYSRYGLERVELEDSDILPFDRIRSHASATVTNGPLVTIIMSCFKPGPEIWTGVLSTLAQSWQNLELIVIDDGSGPEYTELLDAIEATDERVRVLRPQANRGTYICRNEAIDAARGEYITMQDSDDWMHPRRIELHIAHLLARPHLIANVSSCFRVSEELLFSQEHGFRLKLCEPSLTFHKQRALDAIGYFDPVRKAADGEYRRRLELATGQKVVRLQTLPALTLQRTLSSSLSTSDFGESWMHESRLAYRSAYTQWHTQAAKNSKSLRIERELATQPASARPFPAPKRISGVAIDKPAIDVLVVGDAVVRGTGTPPESVRLLETLQAAVASGKTVGFSQVWTVQTIAETPLRLAAPVQALINSGAVSHVLFDEERTVARVLVPDASTMQFPPTLDSALTVAEVVVSTDSSDPYTKPQVVTGTEALFGVTPTWVAGSELR